MAAFEEVRPMNRRVWFALASAFVLVPASQGQTPPRGPVLPTGYHVVGRFPIGGEGGWDYISIDSEARRLYVSHGSQLEVLDADTGKMGGKIADTPGVHGAAIAPEFHCGFTSNGRDKSVTIFDTRTLATIGKVAPRGWDGFHPPRSLFEAGLPDERKDHRD